MSRELFRKVIHMTVVLIPSLANINFLLAVLILTGGILVYIANESARIMGRSSGFLSSVTVLASRPEEQGFVWGPVTLGLGTLAALLYYPDPAATVAIYALAFGDGVASLAGALWSREGGSLPGGKTLVGSGACFLGVLLSSYLVLRDLRISLFAAVTATLLESIPVDDLDNLAIPLGTGLVVYMFV